LRKYGKVSEQEESAYQMCSVRSHTGVRQARWKGRFRVSEKYALLHCSNVNFYCYCTDLGLGTLLFVKVPRPGDSEGTYLVCESSCHLLLPV